MEKQEGGEVSEKSYQDIEQRTFDFAARVVKMVLQLPNNPATWVIGKQVIDSSTSINSNVGQARSGVSRKDFINHMKIARKEAKETYRWIQMIVASGLTTATKTEPLLKENEEIIKILVSIVKKSISS